MHKFYWKNTQHGSLEGTERTTNPSDLASEYTVHGYQNSSHPPTVGTADGLDRTAQKQIGGSKKVLGRVRRMSARNARPKSVADMDDLQRNLRNVKIVNTNATEYNSIEHLEAARYAETYTRPRNPPAQVRPSRSLYFPEQKSRTWNQSDMKKFRNTGETEASRLGNKRLSISSFRYDDTGPAQEINKTKSERTIETTTSKHTALTCRQSLPQHLNSHNSTQSTNNTTHLSDREDRQGLPGLHRSKSCDRARDSVVKTFKISSDKIQANLSKFSNSIHNKLDEKGKCKLSVNCISSKSVDCTADFYKPTAEATDCYSTGPDYEDPSAGFCDPVSVLDCIAPASHETRHKISDPRDSAHNQPKSLVNNAALSCTEPQELFCKTGNRPGLSMTMRGKIHTANKKLSMIRSRSMDRFSKRQEVIPVTPRPRPAAEQRRGVYSGPFIGQARAVVDFTPNPYDREALRLQKGDLIDIIDTHPSGMWRGCSHGKVGNFKFLNVETLPSRTDRTDSREDSKWRRVRSVQEFLIMLDLEEYIPVFVLNGFETVAALNNLDEAELDYLGIRDLSVQNAVLIAVGSIFDSPDLQFSRGVERDSGCYMSDRQTSQGDQESRSQEPGPSSSESGVSEEEFSVTEERIGRSGRSKNSRTLHVNTATMMMHGLSS